MKNSKQWAKAIMTIIIGVIPISFAGYVHETWYYIFLTLCSLFGILGFISFFHLFIYTVLFPNQRNILVKGIYWLSILISISAPFWWIFYNESNPQRMLQNNYEVVEATLKSSIPNEKEHTFTLSYDFELKGKHYQSKKTVAKEPKTNPFYIKYLPTNPEVNEPVENK